MTTKNDTMIEPVSRFHISQGLKLHYLDWNNEGAPLLLLIHGMRDHAHSWDWTARALRNDWHVIAPDLRGHGDSQWSNDGAYLAAYHTLDIADLIDTLIDKYGHQQVTIVAHSFGGNAASRYAAMFPERVKKLVLVDGLGPSAANIAKWNDRGFVSRTREWIDKRREATTRPQRRFATVEEAVERMAAANKHLTREQARHLAIHGVRQYEDGYGWKYDPAVGVFLPEDFAVDLNAFFREIAAPTLLCYGPESWTPHPDVDGCAALFRNHQIAVIENAGHWLHHDQFDAFIKVLRDFL